MELWYGPGYGPGMDNSYLKSFVVIDDHFKLGTMTNLGSKNEKISKITRDLRGKTAKTENIELQ